MRTLAAFVSKFDSHGLEDKDWGVSDAFEDAILNAFCWRGFHRVCRAPTESGLCVLNEPQEEDDKSPVKKTGAYAQLSL